MNRNGIAYERNTFRVFNPRGRKHSLGRETHGYGCCARNTGKKSIRNTVRGIQLQLWEEHSWGRGTQVLSVLIGTQLQL